MDMLKIHTRGEEASALEGSITNARRVVVLAPHPDDEVLGCGGTVLQLNRGGASSVTVCVTNGERLHGDPSRVVAVTRQNEARHAAGMMGCREPLFLGLPDGGVNSLVPTLTRELRRVFDEQAPDLVFAPSPIDYHDDHIATAAAALSVFRERPSFSLTFYEIYGTVRFNCLVDITTVTEEKKRLILSYRTSLYEKPDLYARAAQGLNAHRSLFLQTPGSYEAFWVLTDPLTDRDVVQWLTYGISRD